ncbi:Gfo/Idh/MocA family oxidoreductase [Micromonospora sp. M12]
MAPDRPGRRFSSAVPPPPQGADQGDGARHGGGVAGWPAGIRAGGPGVPRTADRRDPGLRLDAIVTRDPQRREQARQHFPDARLVDDADELWRTPDALDLVVVATPNRQHVPMARAALAAGLPVVVDKPLTATATEGRALVDEAAERGCR